MGKRYRSAGITAKPSRTWWGEAGMESSNVTEEMTERSHRRGLTGTPGRTTRCAAVARDDRVIVGMFQALPFLGVMTRWGDL
ncbi:hypothetical protein GCM10022224_074380 [Nonomuraea antimicrobica]|uniref:Uncharacterized protein n=1 Tax=Nonomuraea antimicrobica TaxID=561173 RepID=A0ABP7D2Y4_9ACTN